MPIIGIAAAKPEATKPIPDDIVPNTTNKGPTAATKPVITMIAFFVCGCNSLNLFVKFCINTINSFARFLTSSALNISLPNSAKAIFKLSFTVEATPEIVCDNLAIPPSNLPPSEVASWNAFTKTGNVTAPSETKSFISDLATPIELDNISIIGTPLLISCNKS